MTDQHDDPSDAWAGGGHRVSQRTSPVHIASQEFLNQRAADALSAVQDMLKAQTYRYIGKDGKPILARELEDQRDEALQQVAALHPLLRIIEGRAERAESERDELAATVAALREVLEAVMDPDSKSGGEYFDGLDRALESLTDTAPIAAAHDARVRTEAREEAAQAAHDNVKHPSAYACVAAIRALIEKDKA